MTVADDAHRGHFWGRSRLYLALWRFLSCAPEHRETEMHDEHGVVFLSARRIETGPLGGPLST